ncbi:MAG: MFS transporter, partial [Bacteroidota bacterium]
DLMDQVDLEGRNPFTQLDKILIVICSVLGLGYAINDPMSKIAGIDLFSVLEMGGLEGQYVGILFALALFLFLVISRISRYPRIIRDRMIAFIIFAFFTVFFWMSFEQGASSLIIFARDYMQRELVGASATLFNVINALLTIVPLALITWVLFLLFQRTGRKIPQSNFVLIACFLGVWGVVGWMLYRDFNTTAYVVSYDAEKIAVMDEKTNQQKRNEGGELEFEYQPITQAKQAQGISNPVEPQTVIIGEPFKDWQAGAAVNIIAKDNESTTFAFVEGERLTRAQERGRELNRDNGIIDAKITEVKNNWVEVTVSWFSILNSFFIIAFASFFARWWDSKYNPSAAVKYGLGLIIMAIGFGLLAFGSYGLEAGAKASMVWLILAYLFHTLGELCLSPVGLSYVSKLVPARMIAFMFGMWYLAIAIGNKLAAVLGGQIENITEAYSMSTFFLIFTIVPIAAGVLVILLNPVLKRLMHGVR